MQLFLFLLSFFLLSSGFPSLNFSPNVFVPKNLTVKKEEGRYYIYFNAYNPNDALRGYNIYYGESKYEIEKAYKDHQTTDLKKREETQKTFIIQNNKNEYPSIPIDDLIEEQKQNPKKEVIWVKEHELKNPPLESKRGPWFNPPFYLAVSAVIFYKNQESRLSEIISVERTD